MPSTVITGTYIALCFDSDAHSDAAEQRLASPTAVAIEQLERRHIIAADRNQVDTYHKTAMGLADDTYFDPELRFTVTSQKIGNIEHNLLNEAQKARMIVLNFSYVGEDGNPAGLTLSFDPQNPSTWILGHIHNSAAKYEDRQVTLVLNNCQAANFDYLNNTGCHVKTEQNLQESLANIIDRRMRNIVTKLFTGEQDDEVSRAAVHALNKHRAPLGKFYDYNAREGTTTAKDNNWFDHASHTAGWLQTALTDAKIQPTDQQIGDIYEKYNISITSSTGSKNTMNAVSAFSAELNKPGGPDENILEQLREEITVNIKARLTQVTQQRDSYKYSFMRSLFGPPAQTRLEKVLAECGLDDDRFKISRNR